MRHLQSSQSSIRMHSNLMWLRLPALSCCTMVAVANSPSMKSILAGVGPSGPLHDSKPFPIGVHTIPAIACDAATQTRSTISVLMAPSLSCHEASMTQPQLRTTPHYGSERRY
jgi:hypothetical protein